jgi:uncharacterized protein YndB with AHSA1/START domain
MIAKNSGALTVTLPSDREITLTRVFAAPRALVFEAHTKPEHVKRWFGPRGIPFLSVRSTSAPVAHGATSCATPRGERWE